MAHRRFQRGYVYQRGETWYGRWREDLIRQDGQIARVQKNVVIGTLQEYRTKRLATGAMERLLFPVNIPCYRPGRVSTVTGFADRWIADVLARQKPSAQQSAESHLRAHIIPQLGNVRLDNLGVEIQQAFVNQISGKVSRTTVENILATLSSMLNSAKNWGYICEPIVLKRLVLPPRGIRQQARMFTPEQSRDIIQLASNPYRLMFAIAAYAGIRAGEIMGLRAEDIDLQREIMTIRQSSWHGKLQAPKSVASENSVPIPGPLLDMLKEYGCKSGLLFVNAYNRPFNAQKVVEKRLSPICETLRIPRAGFHAFRHMHTTLLFDTGASPKVAQRQLRHSDARLTLNVYAHLVEQSHRDAVEKVAERLFRSCSEASGKIQVIQ
jgi:integrase